MHELLPIMGGVATGLVLGLIRPTLRVPLGLATAIVLGFVATMLSGEFQVSWGYLLVDVPLVGLSSVVGLLLGRWVRTAPAVPNEPGGRRQRLGR